MNLLTVMTAKKCLSLSFTFLQLGFGSGRPRGDWAATVPSESQQHQPAAQAVAEHGAGLFAGLLGEYLLGDPHYSFFQSVFRNVGTGSQPGDVSANPADPQQRLWPLIRARVLRPFQQL